jgi:hypothetical protein
MVLYLLSLWTNRLWGMQMAPGAGLLCQDNHMMILLSPTQIEAKHNE